MKSKAKYLVLLHIALFIFSSTGIASKLASGADFLSFRFCFFYGLLICGMGVYAILWQQIIKKLPLITAYANKAVTVIWGIVFGYLIFDEAITLRKIIGAAIIIAGVYLIVTSDAIEEMAANIGNELSSKEEDND